MNNSIFFILLFTSPQWFKKTTTKQSLLPVSDLHCMATSVVAMSRYFYDSTLKMIKGAELCQYPESKHGYKASKQTHDRDNLVLTG